MNSKKEIVFATNNLHKLEEIRQIIGNKFNILSLEDINDETQHLIRAWNNQNSDKAQHPIFRTSMGGTIFFTVKEDDSYKQMEICKETDS